MSADLHLRLKTCYFNEIRAGVKQFEFRLRNDYWTKRLTGKKYNRVIFHDAYKKSSPETMIIEPYRGYACHVITHPHFGPDPVQVFAIRTMEVAAS